MHIGKLGFHDPGPLEVMPLKWDLKPEIPNLPVGPGYYKL